jgi:prepilin-type N-terminal cleavage/methylation domain-containing protein/prepilin-type processing-associated H-X9-DG protein
MTTAGWNAHGSRAAARGFTLIELLTVIALITILAGLLFPVLARARDRAYQVTCLSNMRQIASAHQMYVQDNDDRFPDWARPLSEDAFGPYRYWPEMLRPYGVSGGVLRDPSFAGSIWADAGKWLADYVLPTWGPSGTGTAKLPYFRWPGSSLTMAQVGHPTETASLIDGWTATQFSHIPTAPRHAGGVNVGFVDAHARWMTSAQFWRVRSDGLGFHWFEYLSADR